MKDILSTRPNFVPQPRSEVKNPEKLEAITIIEEAKSLPCKSEPMFLDELHEILEKCVPVDTLAPVDY